MPAKKCGRSQLHLSKCWRNPASRTGARRRTAGTPVLAVVVGRQTGEQCAACPCMRVAHGGAERDGHRAL